LTTYTLTELGAGIAYGINDSGLVVGGDGRAFMWDSTHGKQEVQTLGGDGLSTAYGVSPAGLIVGEAPAPIKGNPRHAFLNDHGTVTDLGTFGGALSAARGVNDAGQVVGWAYEEHFGVPHAFLWDSDNGLQELGTLGGHESYAFAINSSGVVVGETCCGGDGTHAFVWDSTSGMSDIAGGGVVTGAFGVNDAGQVVGGVRGHAFLYDRGTLIDLGNLGHEVASATAINDAGVIVGGADARDSFEHHGFVYADGVMTDLNDLVQPGSGLTIHEAYGINNAGQIVGYAQDRFSHNHAILLTPDTVGAPRGVEPGALRLPPPVQQAAPIEPIPNSVLAHAPQEPARTERVAPLAAGAAARRAADAAFASGHQAHTPAPLAAWEVEGLGLAPPWSL
jgi:probable HAF family extracellular repeat protein